MGSTSTSLAPTSTGSQGWEPGGPDAPEYPEAEDEMVDFVKSVANYTRVEKGHPDFQVFVQNAKDLSRHPDYV